MKKVIIIIYVCIHLQTTAQTPPKDRIIYGICNKDSLLQEPYSKWFKINYETYTPNTEVLAQIKKQNLKDVTVKIYFGTWCGDSKREVSRFYKLLDEAGIKENKVQLIGLGTGDSLTKQSPTGEEKNEGIFRVPVFVLYKNGKELQRINEFPVQSLEKDLLTILNNEPYTPNYASFAYINKWLKDGTLLDDNVTAVGLANQIRYKVNNENELNSLGYLLLKQKYKKEALKVFKINNNLYPTSANVMSSLGEAFLLNEDKAKAVAFLELALQENKDKETFKGILDLLYEAKGVKK